MSCDSKCNHFNGGEREPTEQDILDWAKWDRMSDHLAIRHTCPNCNNNSTRWIGRVWNICYRCHIGFTFEDMEPVNVPEVVSDYQAMVESAAHEDYEANKWEQIARQLEGK